MVKGSISLTVVVVIVINFKDIEGTNDTNNSCFSRNIIHVALCKKNCADQHTEGCSYETKCNKTVEGPVRVVQK